MKYNKRYLEDLKYKENINTHKKVYIFKISYLNKLNMEFSSFNINNENIINSEIDELNINGDRIQNKLLLRKKKI